MLEWIEWTALAALLVWVILVAGIAVADRFDGE